MRNYINLYLDLEATGPNPRIAKITQIAAVASYKGKEIGSFNNYVNPTINVSPKAAELTGLTLRRLRVYPKVSHALGQFFDWVATIGRQFKNSVGPAADIRLIAHSGNRFDYPLIFSEMKRCSMDPRAVFKQLGVNSTLDTYYWAKYGMPKQLLPVNCNGAPGLSLSSLFLFNVNPTLHGHYKNHDALHDSYMLMHTCRACGINSPGSRAKNMPVGEMLRRWKASMSPGV